MSYRKITVLKSIPNNRHVRKGEVVAAHLTLPCLRGMLDEIARHRGVPNDMALFSEFFHSEILPGRPVSV